MVSEKLRLSLNRVREGRFEDLSYTGMQFLASALQQCVIGRVLHQRVLEGVFGVRRRPAPEDQLGAC